MGCIVPSEYIQTCDGNCNAILLLINFLLTFPSWQFDGISVYQKLEGIYIGIGFLGLHSNSLCLIIEIVHTGYELASTTSRYMKLVDVRMKNYGLWAHRCTGRLSRWNHPIINTEL